MNKHRHNFMIIHDEENVHQNDPLIFNEFGLRKPTNNFLLDSLKPVNLPHYVTEAEKEPHHNQDLERLQVPNQQPHVYLSHNENSLPSYIIGPKLKKKKLLKRPNIKRAYNSMARRNKK